MDVDMSFLFGAGVFQMVCPECGGSGKVINRPLPQCAGSGRNQVISEGGCRVSRGVARWAPWFASRA